MFKYNDFDWKDIYSLECKKPYFTKLMSEIEKRYEEGVVYPEKSQIFRAFELCSYDTVRIVIVGQDPYHGVGQAHGLAFSVPDGVQIPPSLRNILNEVSADLGIPIENSGDLSRWARQGVLLLNTTLTVAEGCAGSHQGLGWEEFTEDIIDIIAQEREHVVFLLWGRHARAVGARIDPNRHLVLESVHPSPLSAHRGAGFFGHHHFSRANEYLKQHGLGEIDWR